MKIAFSTETPDTLNVNPISLNIPATGLANGTMQYAMISLKEKQVTLPDRLDEPRYRCFKEIPSLN
jgi:hypothetical protein